jgi:hypothetical protein
MTGYEETLLARAEMLEDASELVQAITAVLAGAQRAGVDPAVVTSLQAAARVLDPSAMTRSQRSSQPHSTAADPSDTVPSRACVRFAPSVHSVPFIRVS